MLQYAIKVLNSQQNFSQMTLLMELLFKERKLNVYHLLGSET